MALSVDMEENERLPHAGSRDRKWIALGCVIWLVAFAWSFVGMWLTKPTGDGFTRGLNRIEGFFLWQIVAVILALVVLVYGINRFKDARGWRWLSRLPMLCHFILVLYVAGTVVFFQQKQRSEVAAYQEEMQNRPVAATAKAITPIIDTETADSVSAVLAQPPLETFRGVYRSGFEASEFYPLDPGMTGPWWLEADDENWDVLQAHQVERPGRGSSVTVILSFSGRRYTGAGFGHLGAFDTKVQIVSIDGIRSISEAEFNQVLDSVR